MSIPEILKNKQSKKPDQHVHQSQGHIFCLPLFCEGYLSSHTSVFIQEGLDVPVYGFPVTGGNPHLSFSLTDSLFLTLSPPTFKVRHIIGSEHYFKPFIVYREIIYRKIIYYI